ncbi:hypothetical protein, partial [Paraprevotella clara]
LDRFPRAWLSVSTGEFRFRKPDIKLFGRFLLRLLAETFRPFLLFLFPYPLAVLEAVHSSAVFGRQSGSPVVALCR